MTVPNYPVAQIAYFVADIEVAAEKMHKTVGAGPFFVVKDIELRRAVHRGVSCLFIHSSAYGQWGNVMLELVQQESIGPSPFRDLYQPGETGLHHLATIVPDQQEAYAAYRSAGFEVATIAETTGGTEFAFVDAVESLGHFIEVYERADALLGFYDMVKTASLGWRGEQLLRYL
ncbi:MAG: hypothetical protein GKR90_20445 [Pseudomonadales bacterium]|nr:hypothetical protein [Pseudomonadales bacterium]